jgi:hypothetical protein
MDTAHCLDDSKDYVASAFAGLPAADVARKRRSLICVACREGAYFRKRSTSGQGACFGARHANGCELSKVEPPDNDDARSIEDYELTNDHSIIVDLVYGAASSDSSDNAKGPVAPGGSGRRHSLNGSARSETSMQRRLRTLLFNLIKSAAFRESTQLVIAEDFERLPVAEFFVPFGQIDSNLSERRRGFWGVVTDARETSGESAAVWLNYGRSGDFSVLVSIDDKAEVLRRFRLHDIEELSGADVLVLGLLRMSKNGKLYVKASDASHITIRPARP